MQDKNTKTTTPPVGNPGKDNKDNVALGGTTTGSASSPGGATSGATAGGPSSANGATAGSVGGAGAAPKVTTAAPKPAPKSADASKSDKSDTKTPPGVTPDNDFVKRIVERIRSAENILVTLSRDPSIDELAAAVALTLFLDSLQKHTTAIYSGATPDSLKFLQPEETFENNTDSLQDFIITLSKDKADHLRYKLDGDYVKVFITPYKTVLTEEDLEFSHGDYNVDLVLALGVPQATDLDPALMEYGKIMHGATTVDITCDAPGRFGEIEWSDPGASSVSEMITKLIFAMQGQDEPIDKEIATALLTGIVAATGRFSNDRTNSETMQLASKLMTMGADQQLISAHIVDNTPDLPEVASMIDPVAAANNPDNLLVGKDYANYTQEIAGTVVPADIPTEGGVQYAGMLNQAQAGAAQMNTGVGVATGAGTEPSLGGGSVNGAGATGVNIEPSGVNVAPTSAGSTDYAAMMAAALAEPMPGAAAGAVTGASAETGVVPGANMAQSSTSVVGQSQTGAVGEQAAGQNGQVVLPPPPAPNVGAEAMPPVLPPVQVPEEMVAAQQAKAAADQLAQDVQAQQVKAQQAQQAQAQVQSGQPDQAQAQQGQTQSANAVAEPQAAPGEFRIPGA